MPVRTTPAQIRKMFRLTVTEMEHQIGRFVKRPGKDFTRHRSCTFQNTILAIMTMEAHSLKRELFEYYRPLKKNPPTRSAFIQSRKKLNDTAFPYLLRAFNRKIPFHKTYKGLHLLACDGTDSNIPADAKDPASLIPFNSNNGGYYQNHTVVMFDLLEKRYTDAVIQPRRELNETQACCEMIDRNPISGKCCFIADRGFMSFNLMAHAVNNHQFYLIRVKDIDSERSPFKYYTLPDGEGQVSVEFVLSRKQSQLLKTNPEKYKWLHTKRHFDYIPPRDKKSIYILAFRLVKVLLPNGTFEYLVTNLPEADFPIDEIKNLYNLRWKVEVSFLFLKHGMAMNFFHCLRRDFINQEIFAKLILFNFISLIVSCVDIPANKPKPRYQVSFSDAIYKCRQFLLTKMKNSTILNLLLRDLTPLRPGRSFQRNMKSQCLKSLQNRT